MKYAFTVLAALCLVLAPRGANGQATNSNSCEVTTFSPLTPGVEIVLADITVSGDASPNPVPLCDPVFVSSLQVAFPTTIVSDAAIEAYNLGFWNGNPNGLNPIDVQVQLRVDATNASPAGRWIFTNHLLAIQIEDSTPGVPGDESIVPAEATVDLPMFQLTPTGGDIVIELSEGQFTLGNVATSIVCDPDILPVDPFETINVTLPSCDPVVDCNFDLPDEGDGGDCNSCGGCDCFAGWTGLDCSTPTCDPVTDCNNSGQCVAGDCVCDAGYTGANCEIAICTSDCNGAPVGIAHSYVKLDCTSDPIPCDDPVQGGTVILDESRLTFEDVDLPVFDQGTINLGQAVGTMTIPTSAFVCAGGANDGSACDPEADPTECPDGICAVSFGLAADPPTTPESGTFQATYLSGTGTLDFFGLGDYVCPPDLFVCAGGANDGSACDPEAGPAECPDGICAADPTSGVCGPLPGEPWYAPFDATFITTDAQLSGSLVDAGLPTAIDDAPVTYALDGALTCATTFGHTDCNGTTYLSAFLGFSTPTGPNQEVTVSQIYVDPTDPTGETVIPVNLNITYDQIDPPEPPAEVFTTVVTTSEAAGEISSNYQIEGLGVTPVFFDITTNGVIPPGANVTVCVEYQEPSIDECSLRLLHNDDADPNEFLPVTLPDDVDCPFAQTCGNGWCINPTSNQICGRSPGLSPFKVAADIGNSAPTIASIEVSPIPEAAGQPVTAAVSFCDPDLGQDLYVEVDWGDDVVTQTAAVAGACDPYQEIEIVHTYMTAGVYTVTVMVSDSDGAFDSQAFEFAILYDPNAGFVTGGGWIDSPAGAYVPDPSLTGRANFGFVSKYKKGANVPTGNTQFRYRVADLNFKSTSYQWLVIAGAKAKFKGDGTINGIGNYGFMLTAVDGALPGGGDSDKFRIKIWDKDNADAVIYDNQIGDSDNANPTTILGGGSIVIHEG